MGLVLQSTCVVWIWRKLLCFSRHSVRGITFKGYPSPVKSKQELRPHPQHSLARSQCKLDSTRAVPHLQSYLWCSWTGSQSHCWTGGCLVLEPQGFVTAFCRWCGSVSSIMTFSMHWCRLVCRCSNPHLWSWGTTHDSKNEILDPSGWNEFPSLGDRAQPYRERSSFLLGGIWSRASAPQH